jgi:hypothetical protein
LNGIEIRVEEHPEQEGDEQGDNQNTSTFKPGILEARLHKKWLLLIAQDKLSGLDAFGVEFLSGNQPGTFPGKINQLANLRIQSARAIGGGIIEHVG